jgi:hypothetical protein
MGLDPNKDRRLGKFLWARKYEMAVCLLTTLSRKHWRPWHTPSAAGALQLGSEAWQHGMIRIESIDVKPSCYSTTDHTSAICWCFTASSRTKGLAIKTGISVFLLWYQTRSKK